MDWKRWRDLGKPRRNFRIEDRRMIDGLETMEGLRKTTTKLRVEDRKMIDGLERMKRLTKTTTKLQDWGS
jgi:hypothetical protein